MKRVSLACVLVLITAAISSAQVFHYPHVANGVLGGTVWKTTIFLTNPNPVNTTPASGSVAFYKDDPLTTASGTSFNISFVDENGQPVGSGNTIPFQLSGGQSRKFTSTGTGPYGGGFATVTATVALGGTAIFSQFDLGGRLIAEAGVPSTIASEDQAIFVDTLGGYNVGVAVANQSLAQTTTILRLLNSSAQTIATTSLNLGPRNHKAAFVTELFPGAPLLSGTMRVDGTSQHNELSVVALRFDPTFSVFTTLPPINLISFLLEPALEWFQQLPWVPQGIRALWRLTA
jgi:hypothetical protein